jgi:ribosome-associated heat shock protein Hsp15
MNSAPTSVRIDKWLWAARVFKTRTLAGNACRHGHVTVAGRPVKPSREVRPNDVIVAKTGDLTRTLKVVALLDRRVAARALEPFVQDLTPPSEYTRPRETVLPPLFARPKGLGRPTKRDRRQLDKLF